MKLWLLRPVSENQVGGPWSPWYDKAFGFVVRAMTEQEARQYAAEDCGDEGGVAWLDSALSKCAVLTPKGATGVVIRDFKAA